MSTLWKAVETFLIGVLVVGIGAAADALTNYHPTGESAWIWAIVGAGLIGGLRALLSWLIIKQASIK